ncbi:MAG: PEP-CTERM sorting domain-containing protein [Planctomycetota bacterium]
MKTVVIASIAGLAASTASAGVLSNNVASNTSRVTTIASDLSGMSVANRGSTLLSIDISGINSWDLEGAFDNESITSDIAAALGAASGTPVGIDGIGWDVSLDTVGASWLSEATILFDDADAPGSLTSIALTVGVGDDFAGSASYSSSGVLDLAGAGLGDIELSQGNLLLDFFESYDDVAGAIDATFGAGSTLTISAYVVPAPASAALLGLGGLVATRRRR